MVYSFHSDPKLSRQIARTMGYAVYHGAELDECLHLSQSVNFSNWFEKWSHLADKSYQSASSLLDPIGQKEAFLRASNYFRTAFVFLEDKDPRTRKMWKKSKEAFEKAFPSLKRVGIPFEEIALPAYYFPGNDNLPIIVDTGGSDTTLEELYFRTTAPATQRGFGALIFEGPGQGGLYLKYGIKLRHDWERVIASVVDYLETKIVLRGSHLGGFLAARAATCERAISALILDPYSSLSEEEILRFDAESSSEMELMMQEYSLEGLEEKIECPVLMLDEREENFLYDKLSCMKEYVIYSEGLEISRQKIDEKIYSWLHSILIH